jgi:RNA polymerase sigma factor (sigma-70 family)
MDDTSDLIHRATAGDVKAVRALVGRITPIVKARATRALHRHGRGLARRDVGQEVGDLVQLVLSALFQDGGKLVFDWDPERGRSFDNYIALVADSRISSVLRTRRGQVWPDDPTEDEDLEDSSPSQRDAEAAVSSRQELSLILGRLRASAPDRAYHLFTLLYVDEKSAEEVSALVGLSVENVHTHKSRLGKLARRIASEIASHDAAASPPAGPLKSSERNERNDDEGGQ